MEPTQIYQDVWHSSPDAILYMVDNVFIDCNPAALRMFQADDKEAFLSQYQQFHPSNISPPQQPDGEPSFEKAERMLAEAAAKGTHTFEWTHVDTAGKPFLVEVQLTNTKGSGNEDTTIAVLRDISERKLLEQTLRESQRMEAVGRLAAGVAHDFNNLLLVIMGHAELLADEIRAGHPDITHLAEVQGVSKRAARLTRQLLTFSRGHPRHVVPLDLGRLVHELQSLILQLVGRNIEVDIRTPEERCVIVSDPTEIEQVIINLAKNAADAMPDGGRLEIEVCRAQRSIKGTERQAAAVLRVTDNGCGIPPEMVERVFEPFLTTKQLRGGTGLGLATARSVIDQSGGSIELTSEQGRGTTFEIVLPHVDVAPTADDSTTPEAGETPNTPEARILVVDDEDSIRNLLLQTLRDANYRVDPECNGADAWQNLTSSAEAGDDPFDLIVTDINMPGMSGAELVKRVFDRWPNLPIVVLSGYSDTSELETIMDIPTTTVLAKPLSLRLLHGEIRRGLDGR